MALMISFLVCFTVSHLSAFVTIQFVHGSAALVFVILIPIINKGEYYVKPNLDLGTFVRRHVCIYTYYSYQYE